MATLVLAILIGRSARNRYYEPLPTLWQRCVAWLRRWY